MADELAHANLPGERHAKRWQDVGELLASGIDVYTTLNVANIESLGPTVSRITGVRQAEPCLPAQNLPGPGHARAGLAADGSVTLPARPAWGRGVYSVPAVSAKISSAIW